MGRVIFLGLVLSFFARSEVLPVKNFYSQENTNWCWAALTQVYQDYYLGYADRQCIVVTQNLRQENTEFCCDSVTQKSAQCNQPYYLNRTLKKYNLFVGFNNTIASLDQLRIEFNKERPVTINVKFEDYSHYLFLYGIKKDFVYVYDSRNGGDKSIVSKKALESYKEGRWIQTYFSKDSRSES